MSPICTPIFHYIISAHDYDPTSSGLSRGIGASDLIVSLGSWTGGTGTTNEQAGTLMNELGHNLSLHHGGGDDTNFKPNYLSIMSYAFQTQGLIKGGAARTFDYSRSALPVLDETSLNEPAGLGAGATGYGTRYSCSGSQQVVLNASGPIDWNCSGVITETGISAYINDDSATNSLSGYNDWANLKLKGGAIGLAGITPDLPMTTPVDRMTVEIANSLPPVGSTYTFTGFFQPVDNPGPTNVFNTAKAGSAIPVKFSLGGDQGLTIFAAGYPKAVPTACPGAGTPTDPIEETVNAGAISLQYDPVTQQYTYVWKTQKAWATKCYQFVMRLNDGSEHSANFQFTR
jgi:hypothetical protein